MSALLTPAEVDANRIATEELLRRLPKGDLLLGYQRRTLDLLYAGTALLIVEKSRRVGLSWGVAAYHALRAATRVSDGGQTGWYMGYDKEMAREYIEVVAMWARAFGLAAEPVDEEVIADGDDDILAFRVRFSSGLKVCALSSVPRALRGKQGIVVIDEAAFHGNVAEVIKSAMALLIWGGQVIIISTHDGIANRFNLLLDEVRAGRRTGRVVTITFADAMANGLYERVASVARVKGVELPPKEEWEAGIRAAYGEDAAEELDCIPKAGSGSLISMEDIVACEHDDCGRPELYQGGMCFLGRDVARRRDGQVQYCMELIGDVQWQRDTYEEIGQTFAHQDAFFAKMFATRHVVAAGVDQGGMGEPVVEGLIGKYGTRVRGYLLVGPARLAIAQSLKRRFQERRIRIRRDAVTRADLLAIKKIGSEEAGTIRIVNDEDEVHADRFWAYGLGSIVGDLPPALYQYQGVARGARAPAPAGFHPEDRPRLSRGRRFGVGAY